MKFDLLIIGAGPVGIFTAFQAGMLGMRSCIIDILSFPGGQCSAIYPQKPIYDIPGHSKILAQDLVHELCEQAARFSPTYLLDQQVVSLKQNYNANNIVTNEDSPRTSEFILSTSAGNHVTGKSIVIAAGAGAFGPNKPPLANIESYEKSGGVLYYVTNKQNFTGKNILIAGGGDSALDWTIELAKICQVTLVHRRNKFRAAASSVAQMMDLVADGRVRLITDHQLSGLIGNGHELQAVEISDLDGNKSEIATNILVPCFGLAQDLGPLAKFGFHTNRYHQIEVSLPYYATSLDGIYAVGDIASYEGKLKLILTGFAEAASAVHHTYSRVFDGKALHFEHSTSKFHN